MKEFIPKSLFHLGLLRQWHAVKLLLRLLREPLVCLNDPSLTERELSVMLALVWRMMVVVKLGDLYQPCIYGYPRPSSIGMHVNSEVKPIPRLPCGLKPLHRCFQTRFYVFISLAPPL